ncbi:MAG: hypothetical protein ABIN58_12210, partial [candidate division WOR-3 bacterium]
GETDYHGTRGEEVKSLYPLQEKLNFTMWKLGPQFGESFIFFNQNPGKDPKTGKPARVGFAVRDEVCTGILEPPGPGWTGKRYGSSPGRRMRNKGR